MVAIAPAPFSASDLRQPGVRSRFQWRTIPTCESVKAVKTPITYRWISALTSALNAQISSAAIPARTTIPLE